VINVTPDSFSDGGKHFDEDAAVAHGARLLVEGADVLDVGGESSRPRGAAYGAGAETIDAAEEIRRVAGVVRRLARDQGARVSIDTVKAEVAAAALDAGAVVINDVGCGRDAALLRVAADRGVELVLMQNRGRGEVDEANTAYGDVVADVVAELAAAVARAEHAGVLREKIWIDPGIGFAKTWRQSLALLARIDALVGTGLRVLVGPSRKAFIAEAAPAPSGDKPGAGDRAGGTAAAVTLAVLGGAHAVRVHDVAAMRQAVRVAEEALAARGRRAA
jgi:dihydropteroate synthase